MHSGVNLSERTSHYVASLGVFVHAVSKAVGEVEWSNVIALDGKMEITMKTATTDFCSIAT